MKLNLPERRWAVVQWRLSGSTSRNRYKKPGNVESILPELSPIYPPIHARRDAPGGGLGDVADGLQPQCQWQSAALARDARPYPPIAQTPALLAQARGNRAQG